MLDASDEEATKGRWINAVELVTRCASAPVSATPASGRPVRPDDGWFCQFGGQQTANVYDNIAQWRGDWSGRPLAPRRSGTGQKPTSGQCACPYESAGCQVVTALGLVHERVQKRRS
jgi:hypothetical protein